MILKHADGVVNLNPLESGKTEISVNLLNQELFMPIGRWETSYPLSLIEEILSLKGPAYLCDEIRRDEFPLYIQHHFRYGVLGYVNEGSFENKRLLDFGCGCGASTMVLARMFPKTELIGVELVDKFLSIARHRTEFYGFHNVKFLLSSDATTLPDGLGDFDYVVLSGVYEHLLPEERRSLLPKIWSCLRQGGLLFINQTPHRYFPLELHTTGLPLINYLPDNIAFHIVRNFSKRVKAGESRESLLRRGLRGGTTKEIMTILNRTSHKPVLLEPQELGIKDQIDLWYKLSSTTRLPAVKKVIMVLMRSVKFVTGITLTPTLSLAIKKV